MAIDKDQIQVPTINIDRSAQNQLKLLLTNDWTIKDKVLRFGIETKGCQGFEISISFLHPVKEDLTTTLSIDEQTSLTCSIDPMLAFYYPSIDLTYFFDPSSGDEGFMILNQDQEKYHGKFWKDDPSLIPPQKD